MSNINTDTVLLQEKNNFYQKLLNNIPNLIFQLTISSDNNFNFSFLNRNMISFFEIKKDEYSLCPIEIIKNRIHPEDAISLFESIFSSKKNATSLSHEFRIQLINKGTLWLKVDANVEKTDFGNIILYGKLTDITDLKNRENKILDSETRHQFALQASKTGIWDINLKTGKLYLSRESLSILKLDENDAILKDSDWDIRIHPDDYQNYFESIELHKKNITPFYENTKRVLAKDGSYKWILSLGKIIERDSNQNPLRIIGTHMDVTADKEKENLLLVNLDIINEQNNRLLNFAHIVSHNLRSHSGNFKMLLNILDSDDDIETKEECFNHLKTTSNALSDTIEHLKELVDINNKIIHKKENLNLNSYLKQTIEILSKDILDSKVKIINNISNQDTVNFNPAYLESIFLNFTTNAIKYSHPDRIPIISYTFVKSKIKSTLLIQDNGLGINLAKHGEKLFGMYKTFHNNDNARGIGLFITKNQIESMGGSIEVDSKVNVGTTFKINFNEEF